MRVMVMAQMHVVSKMMAMAPLRPECARRHQRQQQRAKYKLLHG